MKAIDFLKKFGLEHTKYLIEDTELTEFAIHSTCGGKYYQDTVSVSDLKQIVDAFELVETGLLELKKTMFNDSRDLDYVKNWILNVSDKLLTEKGAKLKQAIKLMEQCQ